MSTRLTMVPWLLIWAVLAGGQVAAGYALVEKPPLVIGIILALQLAKAPFAAARLHDLGRPTDDWILGLVPIVNVGLWWQLVGRTPSAAVREKRIAAFSSELSALRAFVEGLRLFGRGAPILLPLVLVFSVGYGAIDLAADEIVDALRPPPSPPAKWNKIPDPANPDDDGDGLTDEDESRLKTNPLHPDSDHDQLTDGAEVNDYGTDPSRPDTNGDGRSDRQELEERADLWRLAAWGLVIALIPYFLLQLAKRGSATRASWIPALLVLPTVLFAIALQVRVPRDQGLVVTVLVYNGLDILWGTLFGSVLAVITVIVGDRLRRGAAPFDAEAIRARLGDVVAVHGGVYQAVYVGLQVLIPGIYYALAYAFADISAVLEPERPSFARSASLTAGIRRRVFKAHYLGLMLFIVPQIAGWLYAFAGDLDAFVSSLFDPSAVPIWMGFVLAPFWMATVVIIKLTLLSMWYDRVARKSAATQQAVAGAG